MDRIQTLLEILEDGSDDARADAYSELVLSGVIPASPNLDDDPLTGSIWHSDGMKAA